MIYLLTSDYYDIETGGDHTVWGVYTDLNLLINQIIDIKKDWDKTREFVERQAKIQDMPTRDESGKIEIDPERWSAKREALITLLDEEHAYFKGKEIDMYFLGADYEWSVEEWDDNSTKIRKRYDAWELLK